MSKVRILAVHHVHVVHRACHSRSSHKHLSQCLRGLRKSDKDEGVTRSPTTHGRVHVCTCAGTHDHGVE